MKYVQLGEQKASAIGLGLWQFGERQWASDGRAEAERIIRRALDLGVNFFDTAEIYGDGRSEEVLGAALGPRRSEAIIATKVSPRHATRGGVLAAAERSLRRLGTETIDLYQLHWPARVIPLSRTMKGMADLIGAGKIRQVGVSNFSLRLWGRASAALGRPVVSDQVQLNLLHQDATSDLVPYAADEGRVVIAYSPLAQGLLGGRYGPDRRPADFRASSALFSSENLQRLAPLRLELDNVGRAHASTPAQVSLAWLLHLRPVIAIPGASSMEQLEANVAAADIELSDEEWRRLADAGAAASPRSPRRRLRRLVGRILEGL